MARVSVLIVTYNSKDTIGTVLESLNRQTHKDFEVILVDNASTDSTRAVVRGFAPRASYTLKTLFLDKNRGFAGGNNEAYSLATGEFIALLNPDARASETWLDELLSGLERDRSAGICTSRVLTWDGSAVDSAGDVLLSTLRCFKREATENERYKKREYVFSACAAAAMYRREMLDKMGFFDEDFFIQCEDTDLSMRAQVAGWKVLYLPRAVVYHKVGHSIGKASATGVYYSQRNMEFLRIKYLPLSLLVKSLPQMLFGFTADMLYFAIRQRKAGPFFRAKLDALKMTGGMLKKRKYIRKELKKVDNAYLASLVTPVFLNKELIKMKLAKLMPAPAAKDTTPATNPGFLRRLLSIYR